MAETTRTTGGRRRAWLWWLAPLGVAVVAAAIAGPALLLNAVARLQHYDSLTDIAYGDGERRKLDVYRPATTRNAPVIVFFYGGSWQAGAKETYLFLASTLAARGYVVVVPDYRLYPEVTFPDFLKDGAQAIRWARDNAAAHGGDPARLYLMGHSAGAHVAAMLAMDEEWLRDAGVDPRRDLAGLIGVSGPYDFLPLQDETLKVIFHGDRNPRSQPITFAHGRKPPALLMTGADDETVYPRNSISLATRLRSDGNQATDIVYPRFGHITILAAFVPFLSRLFPLLPDIDSFIARTAAVRPVQNAATTVPQ